MSEQQQVPEDGYYVGDAVRVRRGVIDPDIEYSNAHDGWWDNVSLAGWVGIVTDVEVLPGGKEMLTIEWDSHTLRNVPDLWKRFNQQEGGTDPEEFGYMVLADADVKPARPRDTAAERRQARRELFAELDWDDTLAALRDVVGVSEDVDERGEVAWSTRQLRAPLLAHALQGPDVRRGLDELRRLGVTHELFFHEGTCRVDGACRGGNTTARLLKALRARGAGTLVVCAEWDDLDITGEDVRLAREVVVELTPRDKPAQEKPA